MKLSNIPKHCENCDQLMISPRPNKTFCCGDCRVSYWRRTRRINAFEIRDLLLASSKVAEGDMAKAYLHLGLGLNKLLKEIK